MEETLKTYVGAFSGLTRLLEVADDRAKWLFQDATGKGVVGLRAGTVKEDDSLPGFRRPIDFRCGNNLFAAAARGIDS